MRRDEQEGRHTLVASSLSPLCSEDSHKPLWSRHMIFRALHDTLSFGEDTESKGHKFMSHPHASSQAYFRVLRTSAHPRRAACSTRRCL